MTDTFIDRLEEQFALPLPGRPAQHKMASVRRLEELGYNPTPPDTVRIACVLNLLHYHEGVWRTTLIQRGINQNDRHSGQVSFPGGRYEEGDGDLVNVALRETWEEIGVSPIQVRVLGQLTDIYVPISNFLVHPFVGVLQGPPEFTPQPGEVELVLTPPLALFTHPENRKTTDIRLTQDIMLKDVPYFEIDGRIVWGATAMIMSEFLELMPGLG